MTTAEILREALNLSREDREELAIMLIESLDEDAGDDAEREWDEEISRRIREIDEGRAELIPWSEARRRIIAQEPE
jgi:putative addiction module component (TIGR02574 family)